MSDDKEFLMMEMTKKQPKSILYKRIYIFLIIFLIN